MSMKSKDEVAPLMPGNYPSICFWDHEDWDKYLESPEGQTSKRGTMGYLEDKDSNLPSCKTAKAIRKVLCGGWVELINQELAPPSWGRLSVSAQQFIHSLMESAYPDFKFANNGWKLDYLASMTYPAWWKGSLDDNSKWKQKKGKGPKIEDDSTDKVGMKWKGLIKSKEAGPAKCFRGNSKEEDNLTPPTSTTLLSPLLSDASVSPSEISMESVPPGTSGVNEAPSFNTLHAHVEKDSIQCSSNAVANAISIDPLSGANEMQSSTRPILELEDAIMPAATAKLSLIPGMLDTITTPTPVSKSTKGNKFHPGLTKNGRNLCAHRWHKQVKLGRLTEEFQHYYNSLTTGQQKAYDDEATVLAASNKWDTKIICNGMLY
ncbi:hypothetical protein EDC04DRAFT_2910083 [Pisolithus marmoratus]|nr:hypothetical protein EDC04DRAFT_2910083 [Pisolithus marmoratus]